MFGGLLTLYFSSGVKSTIQLFVIAGIIVAACKFFGAAFPRAGAALGLIMFCIAICCIIAGVVCFIIPMFGVGSLIQ